MSTLAHHYRSPFRRFALWSFVLLQCVSVLFGTSPVMANPNGATVVAGSANISQSGNTLNVNVGTNKAVINWQNFSINAGEVTNFNLPGSNSAVLNRVTGVNASMLNGTLNSNGNVYLINPNGIVFGAGGVINVNGFVGSTLNVSNSQFMQGGHLDFQGDSNAKIENYGSIKAVGGDVYLIGASVANHGSISAANGTAGLAAGNDVRLVDSQFPHLIVRPTSKSFGGTGVTNTGTINALQAELMAAGGNAYALAINNTGTIRATGSKTEGGRVYLVADGGHIKSSGTIIAKKGTDGGDVIVHSGGDAGSSVDLSGNIDVSGDENGGLVFLKGADVDLSGLSINRAAVNPGLVYLSTGPHSANIVDPSTEFGSGLLFRPGDYVSSITDSEAGDIVVSTAGGSASITGGIDGVESNGDLGFDGFVIRSANPDEPFLKAISFELFYGGLPDSLVNVTIMITTREPNGTPLTTSSTMSLAALKANYGNPGESSIGINATGGELIEQIKITSNFDGFYDIFGPNAINGFKGVTTASPNIITVQKQTTPVGTPVVFEFELRNNPTAALLHEFGLADNGEASFALDPGSYDITEIVPTGWFLDSIDHSILNEGPTTGVGATVDSTVTTDGNTATVGLASYETVTLTFNNSEGGVIKITKVANGPDAVETNFGFDIASGSGTGMMPGDGDGRMPGDMDGGMGMPGGMGSMDDSNIVFVRGAIEGDSGLENGMESFTVRPGEYTVRELQETGWFFDLLEVSDPTGNSMVNGMDPSATVNVSVGETVGLTFHNTQGGEIKITKVANGPDAVESQFRFRVTENSDGGMMPGDGDGRRVLRDGRTPPDSDGGSGMPGGMDGMDDSNIILVRGAVESDDGLSNGMNSIFVRPGEYTVEELQDLGWFFDFIEVNDPTGNSMANGMDPSATVNVASGERVGLTFHNTQGGEIKITKAANGPDAVESQFSFRVSPNSDGGMMPGDGDGDGGMEGMGGSEIVRVRGAVESDDGLSNGMNSIFVRPGEYTVEELQNLGWFFDSIDVNDPTGNSMANGMDPSATVNVASGEQVGLTFHNTQGGETKITKVALGPDAVESRFRFRVTANDDGMMPGDGGDGGDGRPVRMMIPGDSDGGMGGDPNIVFVRGAVESDDGLSPGMNSIFVRPGEYTVRELQELGWFFDFVSVNDPTGDSMANGMRPSATVNVASGEQVGLTFQNTQGGEIKITKDALGPDARRTIFDFLVLKSRDSEEPRILEFTDEMMRDGGPGGRFGELVHVRGKVRGEEGPMNGMNSIFVRPGEYTVAELPEFGWFFDFLTINDPTNNSYALGPFPAANVNVASGERVGLTFYNTQAGRLKITKEAVGPSAADTVFKFKVRGNNEQEIDIAAFDGPVGEGGPMGIEEMYGRGGFRRLIRIRGQVDRGDGPMNGMRTLFLRPGNYTVEELATAGWSFESLRIYERDMNSGSEGPIAYINISPGERIKLHYKNIENITQIDFPFFYAPIYPDGVGTGSIAYGDGVMRYGDFPRNGENELAGESSAGAFGSEEE